MQSPLVAAGFAAGMLLHLLLVVLVAARPSLRRLERLFLALFVALFLWHAGNYLALRLEAFGGARRDTFLTFARAMAFTGLALLPALLAHLHVEYARQWRLQRAVWLFYLPLIAAPFGIASAAVARGIPSGPWTTRFILYFAAALVLSAVVNASLARRAPGHLQTLHGALAVLFAALAAACVYVFLITPDTTAVEWFGYPLMLSSIVPSGIVGFWMFRYNFLETRAQQTVALAAMGLLGLVAYAFVIQRIARALEDAGYLPSTITETVLVFVLIVAAWPLYRRSRAWMARRVESELSRISELHHELLRVAEGGSPAQVRAAAEEKVTAFLDMPVRIEESGSVRAVVERPLTLREESALRLLSAHTAEAVERSRLLAELADRRKMAALGEMVTFIAHRLKNPLSAINAIVQVIAEQAPETAEHCQVIRGEIQRLNTAVNDLMRFTRPAEAAAATGRVVAREVIDEAAAVFSAEAGRKGVHLAAEADAGITVPARRDALQDVLTSLLGNALEAAPAGSTVSVTAHRNGNRAVLAVEDDGPGVAPELCERIFEPFFTLKPGGTGLGLALARRRAQESGAELRCVSPAHNGRGARFEIIFPLS